MEAAGGQLDATGAPRQWRALSPREATGVLDHIADGVAVLGPDLRCRFINEAAAAILGRAADELLGTHLWSAAPRYAGLSFHFACEETARTGRAGRLVDHHADLDRWIETRVAPDDDNLVVLLRDVTAQRRTQNELVEYADRFAEAERIVGFGVWRWEIAEQRVRWSDELHRIYGLRPGEFPGTVDAFVAHLHPEDRERVWANISRAIETGEPFLFEERIVRADDEVRVLLSQGHAIADSDGDIATLIGVCHDVTQRADIQRELGASERWMSAIIDNTPSLITVKDLDGRYVMSNQEAARVAGLPADGMVGRLCVDLFGDDVAADQRVADQRAATEGEPVYGETTLIRDGEPRSYVTVTFALPDEDGLVAETCTIATDITERKEREAQRREREDWEQRIGSALADGRMLAFAQPIVSLHTGETVAHELLVRMRTAGDEPVILAPDVFLPAAERYGLIQAIDAWMVGQALQHVRDHDSNPQVNISAVTMCDAAARDAIVELLAAAPHAAARIVFEITETAAAEHVDSARAFARDVQRLGSRLALDDFGTGFGSFTYLRSLPLSHIKIDLGFVRDLVRSRDDRRVVQSIISIAEQFGLTTIAEGVEDRATLELLRELGADHVQGFLLGHPAPAG